ncbi:Tyrosine-protein kinase ephrin type A/B receptor-like protein [Gracilaria domingensis]|nr:Tyrosine-protein kinase ephrin type A/B receptor-like protein [Gracilaria domingensis]
MCGPGPNGCPPGSIRKRAPLYPGQFVIQCSGCESGFTTYQNDASVCRRIGYPCPDGHRETSSGDCWRCNGDEYFDLEQERCVSCPIGTGSVSGLARECAPCSQMVKMGVWGTRCMQENLFVAEGRDCPLGSRLTSRDSLNVPICEKCKPGFFSAETNPQECTPCAAGSVASEEGAQRCVRCPSGKKANDERTQCVQEDTGCLDDQELAMVNGQQICRSQRCGNGDNSIEAVKGRVCGPCNVLPRMNKYVTTDGPWAGSCESCPADTLSDGLTCTKCPRGQVRTKDKQCGCRGLLAVMRGVDSNGDCVVCPSGSRGVPGPDGENVCTMCPAGTYKHPRADVEVVACAEERRRVRREATAMDSVRRAASGRESRRRLWL